MAMTPETTHTTHEERMLRRDMELMQADLEAFKVEVQWWRAEFEKVAKHVTTMQCEINALRTARP